MSVFCIIFLDKFYSLNLSNICFGLKIKAIDCSPEAHALSPLFIVYYYVRNPTVNTIAFPRFNAYKT